MEQLKKDLQGAREMADEASAYLDFARGFLVAYLDSAEGQSGTPALESVLRHIIAAGISAELARDRAGLAQEELGSNPPPAVLRFAADIATRPEEEPEEEPRWYVTAREACC